MTWIHIAYLLGLLFLATKLDNADRRDSFRKAWVTFALIPISVFIMHLFRAEQLEDREALQLVEIWEAAISNILLGVSLLFLVGALVPKEAPTRISLPKIPPPKPHAALKTKSEQDSSSIY